MSIRDTTLGLTECLLAFLCPNSPSVIQVLNSEPWFVKITFKLKMNDKGSIFT